MATTATVIVARRMRAGHERAGERWIERLRRAASAAPGFVASEAHPPDERHPDEWLVVYRFATSDDLRAWLDAPERMALLEEGRAHFEDEVREQRLVAPPVHDTHTLVSSVVVKPGTEARHRRLHDDGVRAARNQGGLVRDELLPSVEGEQAETVALLTFDSREALDRWLASDDRRRILAEMDELTVGDRTVNVVGGFAGWFGTSATEPRRWKQAVAVVLGLVPVSVLTTLGRDAVWSDAPLVAAIVASAVVNVIVLTWIVMPWITRRFRRWLVR